MRAVIVDESGYGATHRVATAIAEGVRERGWVMHLPPEDVGPGHLVGADLLIVGCPDHAPARPAGPPEDPGRRRGADPSADPDRVIDLDHPSLGCGEPLRRWFELIGGGDGRLAAAFGTGSDPGAASGARGVARQLALRGWSLAVEPAHFALDTDGDLAAGEVERALAWGRRVAEAVAEAEASTDARIGPR